MFNPSELWWKTYNETFNKMHFLPTSFWWQIVHFFANLLCPISPSSLPNSVQCKLFICCSLLYPNFVFLCQGLCQMLWRKMWTGFHCQVNLNELVVVQFEKELRTEVLTWDYRTEGAWSNNVFSCLCFCKFWLLENHSSKLLSLAIFKVSDLRYFLSFFFPKYWNLVAWTHSGNGKKMGIWFLQLKELVLGRGKFCSFEQKSYSFVLSCFLWT